MKKIFLAAIAAIMSLSASADDFNLYVMSQSDVETSFAVADLQKITFAGGNVVVSTKAGTSSTYAISDIAHMYFNTVSTGIADLSVRDKLEWNGESLTVHGVGGTLRIYQPSGILVGSAAVADGQPVSLSHLPRGIYVVNVDGKSFKIVRK